tara:strand:+ start:2742 stop:3530 length:789 start_codon:yes stop_codon:yes gene_type:complete
MIEKGLPLKFKPYITKNLLRLGHNKDGGYVINKEILEKSNVLLTFGLADEFSFEEDYFKYKPSGKILVYDHTVNSKFWIKHILKWFFHFIRNRTNFFRIFKFFQYRNFFKKKNVNHFKLQVRKHDTEIPNSISIKEIIEQNNITPQTTLLKIDIDMDEYRILDDITNFNFLAVIIEFTHADLNQEKILKFCENNKYKIIHLHGNNFEYPDENLNPTLLEITFANKHLIEVSDKNIDYKLPIEKLDFKNDNKKPDIEIIFKNS